MLESCRMELTLSNSSKRYLQFFCCTVLTNLILGTAEAQSLEQREERLLKCMQSLIMVTTDRAKINFRLLKHLYKTINIITGK